MIRLKYDLFYKYLNPKLDILDIYQNTADFLCR